MKTITGVIIAKNEEKMIRPALESLDFCNEIIVVDNGSSDKTVKISEALGAKVYTLISDDFSEARNFGLSKTGSDYILYLDADERLDEELKNNIKELLGKDSEYSGFKLKRKNFYFGNSQWPQTETLERLFLKDKLKLWKGKLHESPVYEGSLGKMDGFIMHYTHRDLAGMLDKTIDWSSKEAVLRFNSGHPEMSWWRFPRVMITAFLDSYIKKQGFKAGTAGLVESIYQSFSMFVTYAKLWELQHHYKKQNEKSL